MRPSNTAEAAKARLGALFRPADEADYALTPEDVRAFESKHGEIAPGTVLTEQPLARLLGASREPVRAAIQALMAEGRQAARLGLRRQVGQHHLVAFGDAREDLHAALPAHPESDVDQPWLVDRQRGLVPWQP